MEKYSDLVGENEGKDNRKKRSMHEWIFHTYGSWIILLPVFFYTLFWKHLPCLNHLSQDYLGIIHFYFAPINAANFSEEHSYCYSKQRNIHSELVLTVQCCSIHVQRSFGTNIQLIFFPCMCVVAKMHRGVVCSVIIMLHKGWKCSLWASNH